MSMQLAMRINSRNNYSSNRNNTNSENSNSKNTNSENSTSEVDNYGEIVRFQNEIESRIRQNIDSSDSLSAGKADEGTKTQNSVSSSASANNNISVSVENPINSTMVLMSGLFTMQDIGVILTSWVPVLLVLTKDSILHIFKVNSADITPPKRNSSDNTSAMEVAAFNSVVTESRKGIEDTIFVPMSITATSLKEEHGKYLNSGNGISSNSLPTGKNRLTGKGNSPKPNDAQDNKNEKKAEKPKPKPLKTLKKLAMTPDTINDIIENFLDDLDKFENNSTAANKANNSESDMNVFEIVSSLLVSDTFMNPIQSVNITNSSVVLRPSVNQNDNILEIYETIHNSSTGVASYLMNSLLGSVSQRKFAFKNNSQRQLFDWISFLESKTVQHK